MFDELYNAKSKCKAQARNHHGMLKNAAVYNTVLETGRLSS